MAANDVGKGEKVQDRAFLQGDDHIVFLRAQFKVVASAEDKIEGPRRDIRRRRVGRNADNAVERGLHGAGGDAEWLEEKCLHARRNDDGDEEDFDVLG